MTEQEYTDLMTVANHVRAAHARIAYCNTKISHYTQEEGRVHFLKKDKMTQQITWWMDERDRARKYFDEYVCPYQPIPNPVTKT